MIAMAIGLFGVMVMTQVYVTAEHNKNTSTSSGDAMTEGMVAISLLQRHIRMGGYGISDGMLLGCNVVLRTGPPAVTLVAMAPVTINHPRIPAGDANTDTLLVFYASTNGSPQGDVVTAQPDALQYSMRTISSFTVNDFVLVAPQVRNCPTVFAPPAAPVTVPLTLTQITAINNPTISIMSNTGVVLPATVVPSTIILNTPNDFDGAQHNPTPAPSGHMVFNLGPTPPTILAYAIRNGNLTQCDYATNDCSLTANTTNTAVWVPVANNIVSMRAQYGHYAAGATNTSITTYDQITPITACQWIRTPTVRLAVVTRSAQRVENATSSAPVWEGTTANPINLTGLPLATTDKWQNYRYKVHQSLITIRNIAWMGIVAGC